jgi:hypothetical protein
MNEAEHYLKEYAANVLVGDIIWLNICKDQSKYLFAINGYYGNDYSIGESYCELVILLSN